MDEMSIKEEFTAIRDGVKSIVERMEHIKNSISKPEDETVVREFAQKELNTLSNGILALLKNAKQAKELLNNNELDEEMKSYIKDLRELNDKICKMME